MIRAAALAVALLALAGCDPETPSAKAERLAKYPATHVEVFRDEARGVTCWQLGGSNGGISCLPDWMLASQAVPLPSSCTGSRLCAGLLPEVTQ